MAGRYHKTPFQNSTPVLTSPFLPPTTGYGEEHVTSQHTVEVSVSPYLHTPRDAFRVGSYPSHYPVFVQARGLFPRSRQIQKRQESLFPACLWKKNSRFSPLTCPFGVSCCPVVSEGVLPFQCRGSLVGWVPRRLCWLRALVASRFAGGLRGPSRRLGPNGGAAP